MSEFEGRTAIVTGGAQGMGRQYVRLLLEAGANVVIADVNEDAAAATIADLGAGARLIFVRTDVGSIDASKACADRATEAFGGIDYLINNAGLLSASLHRSLIDVDVETYHQVLDVMSHGMLWMTRAVVPSMKERGKGAILNVSSIGAYQTNGLYAVAKVLVIGLTVSLSRELAEFGVRVNAIAPGTVATEGIQPLMSIEQMAQWGRAGGRPTERVAEPEEVARAGLFLLSEAASYVRGQILAVDDGQTIRL